MAIHLRRSELKLAGHSGKIPTAYDLLAGVHGLAENPERKVEAKINPKTNRFDLRWLYFSANTETPDGKTTKTISIDERSADLLPRIIQRERKRHGLEQMSDEQLALEMSLARDRAVVRENPTVTIQYTIDFPGIRRALLKIAYELAFLWFGELYLQDDTAAEIRSYMLDAEADSAEQIQGCFGVPSSCSQFSLWRDNTTHHLAYAFPNRNGSVSIAIRIFDVYAAVVLMTKNADKYRFSANIWEKCKFISIDPGSGETRSVSAIEEIERISAEIVSGRMATPS